MNESLSRPPVELLASLFNLLKINSSVEALIASREHVDRLVSIDAPIGDWLRHVLKGAKVEPLQIALLSGRQFDLTRLPALVRLNEVWGLIERDSTGDLVLTTSQGERTSVTEEEFMGALVLWVRAKQPDSTKQDDEITGSKAAKWMIGSMLSEPGWIAKVVMASVFINAVVVVTSLFAMQVYDRVVPTLAYATLTTLVVGMLIALALDWAMKILRSRILDSVAVKVDKELSQRVFEHLLHLRLDVQPKSIGSLSAQVSGLESVRQFFTSGVVFGMVDLPFGIVFIGFVGIVGGQIAWVYTAFLLVAVVLGLIAQLRIKRLLYSQILRQNERQGVLIDAVRGAESIRASHASWRFAEEWKKVTASIDGYAIQQKAISGFNSATVQGLSSLAYVLAIVVGVWQVEAGLLTMGGMIACSILGSRVIAPISQGVGYLMQWQGVVQSLKLVDQLLNLDLERRSDQTLVMPDEKPRRIDLERVRFAYPESPIQQVVINQTCFETGDRVLLLGPIGSGKSTLLKMIAGLYPPSSGRVRLGDADLWEIEPQVVASQVGYLPQQVHLFKGTLRTNLGFSGTASDSRVLRITKELGVDRIAQTSPLGMDLQISEGGDGLSGGQRQLVALARVMIDQPTVWLLDEPTASLDGESEGRVWDTLAQCIQPQDILIVATHNPRPVMRLATRVMLMVRGEIVKDGKPEEVLPQLVTRAPAQSQNVVVALPVSGEPPEVNSNNRVDAYVR